MTSVRCGDIATTISTTDYRYSFETADLVYL